MPTETQKMFLDNESHAVDNHMKDTLKRLVNEIVCGKLSQTRKIMLLQKEIKSDHTHSIRD